MPKPQIITIEYDEYKFTTKNGGSLYVIDGKDVWLPADLVVRDEDALEVDLPEWLAKEKELI